MESLIIAQLRVCADCAKDAPDEFTRLNTAARPMLREAAAEIERLRAALTEIAEDQKTYLGHGAYDEGPLPGDYCQKLARKALAFHNEQSGDGKK